MYNPEGSIEKELPYYPFDSIIVLGGGLQKIGDEYRPTDYRQGDQFGMLGAGMRMTASIELYLQKKARNFVFATGVTEKNKSVYGPEVPTEAEVYKNKFLHTLEGLRKRSDFRDRFTDIEEPQVYLEDKSSTTLTNIREVLQMIVDHGWQKVAIVSSDYHIPRVQALYRKALERHPEIKADVTFLSAESIVTEAHPGKYDAVIERAYGSDEALKRIANEAKGLSDIESGGYAMQEFQLESKDSHNE